MEKGGKKRKIDGGGGKMEEEERWRDGMEKEKEALEIR